MSINNKINEDNRKHFEILEDDRKKAADFIRTIRKSKNITFAELAEKSGVNVADLHKIEHGLKSKINPFQLIALSKALDIDYKEIFLIVGYLEKNNKEYKINAEDFLDRKKNIVKIKALLHIVNSDVTKERWSKLVDSLLKYSDIDIDKIQEYINFYDYKLKKGGSTNE